MQRIQFVAAIILSFSLIFLATVSAHARPLNRPGGSAGHLHPVQLQDGDSRHQTASQETPVNSVGGGAAGKSTLSAKGQPSSAHAAENKNKRGIHRASPTPSQSNISAIGTPVAYGAQSHQTTTGNYPPDSSVNVHNRGHHRMNHVFNKQIPEQSDHTTAAGIRNYHPPPENAIGVQSSDSSAAGTKNSQPVDQKAPLHGKPYGVFKASDIEVDRQVPMNTNGGQTNNIITNNGNSQEIPLNVDGNNQHPPVNANEGRAAGTENSQSSGKNILGGQLSNSKTGAENSQLTSGSTSGGQPNKNSNSSGENSQSSSQNNSGGQVNSPETGAGNSQLISGTTSRGQSNNDAAAGTKNSQPSGQNKSTVGAGNSEPTSGNTSGGQPNNKTAGTENPQPSGENKSNGQFNYSETEAKNTQPTGGSTFQGQSNIKATGTENSQLGGGSTSTFGGHSNHTETGRGKFQQVPVDALEDGPKDLLNDIAHGIGSLLPHLENLFHHHLDKCNDPNNTNESNLMHEFLEAHNIVRKIFHQPLYTWDEKLAKLANQYATERYSDCAMKHSPWDYGENLAYGGSPKWTATQAVYAWFKESQFYDFKTNTCFGSHHKCGHFTQIVWRDTLSLGCARRPCLRDGKEGVIIVCEYEPPGNYEGENPFVSSNQKKKK